MTSALKACLDYVAPLPPEEKEINWKEQFVRNTVTQTALISLSTGLACYFSISSDLRWAYIKQGIIVFIENLAGRAVSTLCRYAAISERGLFFRTVSLAVDCKVTHYFMPTFGPFQSIFHEAGHAISRYLLYKNCTIQIVSTTLTNWGTATYYFGETIELSKLGSYLGEHYANIVHIAMGPLVDVATSQISLIAALILKASYPQLSKNLFLYTLSTSRNCLSYAWGALAANAPLSNDYVELWKVEGIHPCSAIIGMVAMPLITTLGYLVLRRQS